MKQFFLSLFFLSAAHAQLFSPTPIGNDGKETLQTTQPDAAPVQVVKKTIVKKKKTVTPELSFSPPTNTEPTYSPQTRENLAKAIEQYKELVAMNLPVIKGKKNEIDARLALLGDENLKSFQARHALTQTGVMNPQTLKAMNVPMQDRLIALEKSLARLDDARFAFGGRYITVNIPDAMVETIENGRVSHRYIAVVGKAERASPLVETRITNVNFNPTWTVPTSIIKKDLIPKMQKDPQALAKMRLRILDRDGNEINPASIDWKTEKAVNYTLRQDAGANNSLGQIRIDMPNTEAVYMHDTPSKKLFRSSQRFHSSGCVRVEGVKNLANWLLEPQGFGQESINSALATTARKDVRLKTPVGVAWVYLTGFATNDGKVNFRSDIYDLDKQTTSLKITRAPTRKIAPTVVDVEEAPPAPPISENKSFWSIFEQ